MVLDSLGQPCPGIPTVEYEGKTYNTVQIGEQCWLRENLDVGTMIESNTSGFLQTDNGIIEKYCHDNDPANCEMYGGLYEWPEAMQYTTVEGAQGICPDGWHIPTLAEFEELKTIVNGYGNALKEIGQGGGDGAGTNTSGFSALLAGFRHYNGNFDYLSNNTYFWSATESSSSSSYSLYLYRSGSEVTLGDYIKEDGFSVRCLQD